MTTSAMFHVYYDGDAIRDGYMDIRDLAPAMLALGDLCERANDILNGDRATAKVRIRSDFQRGSFGINVLLDQNLLIQIKEFLWGPQVIQAQEILKFLGLIASGAGATAVTVIKFRKWIRGRKIERAEKSQDGMTIFVKDDSISINQTVFLLSSDPGVSKSLYAAMRPMECEGIDAFGIKENSNSIILATKEDVGSFAPASSEPSVIFDGTSESVCEVVKVPFRKDMAWILSIPGNRNFNARVIDADFLSGIQNGMIAFRKGDLLRVLLQTTSYGSSTGYRTEFIVKEVLQHIPSSRVVPQDLFDSDPDDATK